MIHWFYSLLLILVISYMQVKDEEAKVVRTGLEQIVARCLSDGTGRPITIDNKVYLCGIVPTGERL